MGCASCADMSDTTARRSRITLTRSMVVTTMRLWTASTAEVSFFSQSWLLGDATN